MRLGLCSSAAPDATLAELVEACRRRGLAALELRQGDAHGLHPGGMLDEVRSVAPVAGVGPSLTGYRPTLEADDEWLGRLSEVLQLSILLEGPADPRQRIARAGGIAEAGGRVVMVVHGERGLEDADHFAGADFDLAWDVDPERGSIGADARRLLDRLGDRLSHVRLLGGGPEVSFHEGRGVGEMMGLLALEGYGGTVILAPRESRYRLAWQAWLGRRGGWGCGSRTSDGSLVELTPIKAEGGGR